MKIFIGPISLNIIQLVNVGLLYQVSIKIQKIYDGLRIVLG